MTATTPTTFQDNRNVAQQFKDGVIELARATLREMRTKGAVEERMEYRGSIHTSTTFHMKDQRTEEDR